MDVPEILKIIGEQIQACATGKLAFAEPVSLADRIVIPVAWVRYDFGGGGGGTEGYARMNNQGGGGGGGGQVSVAPAGIIEISPAGTQFIPIPDGTKIFALIASSFGNATGMNMSAPQQTGEPNSRGTKTLGKKEGNASRAANKRIAKKAVTKRFKPPAKKAVARKAVSAKSSRPSARKAITDRTGT